MYSFTSFVHYSRVCFRVASSFSLDALVIVLVFFCTLKSNYRTECGQWMMWTFLLFTLFCECIEGFCEWQKWNLIRMLMFHVRIGFYRLHVCRFAMLTYQICAKGKWIKIKGTFTWYPINRWFCNNLPIYAINKHTYPVNMDSLPIQMMISIAKILKRSKNALSMFAKQKILWYLIGAKCIGLDYYLLDQVKGFQRHNLSHEMK